MFAFNFDEEPSNEGFNFGDFGGFNLFENIEKMEIGDNFQMGNMMMGSDIFGKFEEINNMAAELFPLNDPNNNNLKNANGINLFEIEEENSLDVCKFNENEKKTHQSHIKGLQQETNKIEVSPFEGKLQISGTKNFYHPPPPPPPPPPPKKQEIKLISNEKEVKENTVIKNENKMNKNFALNTFKFTKTNENKENKEINQVISVKPSEPFTKNPKSFPKIEFQKNNIKFEKEPFKEDSNNKIILNEHNMNKNQNNNTSNSTTITLLKPSKIKENLLQNLKTTKPETLNPTSMKQTMICLQFPKKNFNEINKTTKVDLFSQNFALPQIEKEKNSLRKIDELNFNRKVKLNELSLNFLNNTNNHQNLTSFGNLRDKKENLDKLIDDEIMAPSYLVSTTKLNQPEFLGLDIPSKNLKAKKVVKTVPEAAKLEESKVDHLKNIIDLNKEMLRLKSNELIPKFSIFLSYSE